MSPIQPPPRGLYPGHPRLVRSRVTSDRPKVTVVIPCYNYGAFLREAVASVLEQPDVEPRVIVVDDASTDESALVAQNLADLDERVKFVRHTINKGHIATYNDGLELVETEFVSLLSADDLLTPGALSRATHLMSARPAVGFVYGLAQPFSDQIPLFRFRRAPSTIWQGRDWLDVACRRGRNFIMSPEVVMRTAALRSVGGGFNSELPHSADLELWLRLAARWDVGRINRTPQAFYRVHNANMHLTTFATMPVDLRHRAAAFDVLDSEWFRDQVPLAGRLWHRARAGIVNEALLLAARGLDGGSSGIEARELLAVAHALSPEHEPTLPKRLVRRLQRADTGAPPTRFQTGAEVCRRQVDRMRWKTWGAVGLS